MLVAGKGHEDYQIVGTEKRPFDDREEARRALGSLMRTIPRFSPDELAAATGGRWIGAAPPAEVAGVSTDTRTLAPGALFVALEGERFDAHAFLAQARPARRGAARWCAEAARCRGVPAGFAALRGGRHARRARRARALPPPALPHPGRRRSAAPTARRPRKEMVGAILAVRGPALKTEGNLNNEVGVPLTLFRPRSPRTWRPSSRWG